jgi:hypothetical protein
MKRRVDRPYEQLTRLVAGTAVEDIEPDRLTQAALHPLLNSDTSGPIGSPQTAG